MDADPRTQRRLEHAAKSNAAASLLFEEWLERPEVRLLVSLIPPAPQDVVRTTLYAAFRAGWGGGMDYSVASLVDALVSSPPPVNSTTKGPAT
jgi:hypothetical protein